MFRSDSLFSFLCHNLLGVSNENLLSNQRNIKTIRWHLFNQNFPLCSDTLRNFSSQKINKIKVFEVWKKLKWRRTTKESEGTHYFSTQGTTTLLFEDPAVSSPVCCLSFEELAVELCPRKKASISTDDALLVWKQTQKQIEFLSHLLLYSTWRDISRQFRGNRLGTANTQFPSKMLVTLVTQSRYFAWWWRVKIEGRKPKFAYDQNTIWWILKRQRSLYNYNSDRMSWQNFVDESLLGTSQVARAAIHGLDGKRYASSAGFVVSVCWIVFYKFASWLCFSGKQSYAP